MGQGATLFHKGVTSRVPQVHRNLSFHPRGEHVFPQGQGASFFSKIKSRYGKSFFVFEKSIFSEKIYWVGGYSKIWAPFYFRDTGYPSLSKKALFKEKKFFLGGVTG